MEKNIQTLEELSIEIGVGVEDAKKEWDKGNIKLFENTSDLKTYMKTIQENQSIDVYQLQNSLYATDLALLGRK